MTYSWIARIAKWMLNLSVPFIAFGFGRALILMLVSHSSLDAPGWSAFFIGCALFVPVWFVLRRLMRRPVDYLTTLEHELTHIIVGLLFLKRPLSLRVTSREGGLVVLTGSNLWITLAPYFLPTLVLFLLPLDLIVPDGYRQALLAIIGASVAYHLVSTWSEIGVVQSDFKKAGLLQSLWLLPVANLVCYGSILAFVSGGYSGVVDLWSEGAANTLRLLLELARYAKLQVGL
jgi:hypothetical protein